MSWWALYVRPRHEKHVADYLQSQDIETFLPLYQVVRTWQRKKQAVSLPLFPSYVFVRPGRKLDVLRAPGAVDFVRFMGQTAEIPDAQLESIRLASSDFRCQPHPMLNCGDRVRVSSGPFAGTVGVLLRKKNIFRLVISIDALAQAVSVELDSQDVEPAAVPVSMMAGQAVRFAAECHA